MTDEQAMAIARRVARIPVTPALSDEQVEDFADLIDDLDAAAAHAALRRWMQTHDKRPFPSDLRLAVAQVAADVSGAGYLTPDEAWAFVHGAIRSVGYYGEFPSKHPLVKLAVEGMGWQDLCEMPSERLDNARAQFRMAYSALLERAKRETAASEGAVCLPDLTPLVDDRTRQEQVLLAELRRQDAHLLEGPGLRVADGAGLGRMSQALADLRVRIEKRAAEQAVERDRRADELAERRAAAAHERAEAEAQLAGRRS